jgi:hypothetical protein
MVDLSWVLALQNLQQPQVKIASLPPQLLPWQRYAMQRENPLSYIVVKAISASVLLSLKDFPVYVIQFQSVHH